jgi:hypothetical protein
VRPSRPLPQEEVRHTAQLRQELRDYAIELRKLAYTLPDGADEQHDLLRLSERMNTTADATASKFQPNGVPSPVVASAADRPPSDGTEQPEDNPDDEQDPAEPDSHGG